jgi:hypothetical protein
MSLPDIRVCVLSSHTPKVVELRLSTQTTALTPKPVEMHGYDLNITLSREDIVEILQSEVISAPRSNHLCVAGRCCGGRCNWSYHCSYWRMDEPDTLRIAIAVDSELFFSVTMPITMLAKIKESLAGIQSELD